MPISTVIVAATVVDRLAPSDRHASANRSLERPVIPRVAAAALVARQAAVLELDDALPHLVDHLAVVGDHQDRRAGCG